MYHHTFQIGFRFYYWNYHKVLAEKDDQSQVDDCTISDLYVSRKYENLKEEILNNKIVQLLKFQFVVSENKAKKFMDSERVKQMKVSFVVNDPMHYGIDNGQNITMQHLLSIILYTDWSKVSMEFSKTFRVETAFETISMIKEKNREMAIWSMLIRETVEYFGNDGWWAGYPNEYEQRHKYNIGPYYCGLSCVMAIPQFNIRLNGPTSTTKRVEVAQKFSNNDGIIITFNNNGFWGSQSLTAFDASWISNYGSEGEYIWCGGFMQIRIVAIKRMDCNENYDKYCKALNYFDCMLSGNQLNQNAVIDFSKEDNEILPELIQQKLSNKQYRNKYPHYINDCFHAFCIDKKQIVINPYYINHYFAAFEGSIFHSFSILQSKTATFDVIKPLLFELFPNLTSLVFVSTAFIKQNTHKLEIDIPSFLLHIKKSVAVGRYINISIRAHHEYKIQASLSNIITRLSYVNVSWLSAIWNSTLCAYNNKISFHTVKEQDNVKVDVLKARISGINQANTTSKNVLNELSMDVPEIKTPSAPISKIKQIDTTLYQYYQLFEGKAADWYNTSDGSGKFQFWYDHYSFFQFIVTIAPLQLLQG